MARSRKNGALRHVEVHHPIDEEAQLLASLIVGAAEEIGDASVNVENGINAAQAVFTRLFLVINKCGGKCRLVFVAAG